MKHVCIVAPCFNEEENVRPLYDQIRAVMEPLRDRYTFELVYIDNASTDGTVRMIRELARRDPRVKCIVNLRNFGHIRSPVYGLMQADGDANILMASDLQDPPELLRTFLEKWEEGFPVVMGMKTESEESPIMYSVRTAFYSFINRLSDIRLTKNTTGFGLYDRRVLETLRAFDDPYPYFRGLLSEAGYETALVPFRQPTRKRGITKNNFYTLYDMAMTGITHHSKVPLRVATMAGFLLSGLSLLVALGYLIAKLVMWDTFKFGTAPVLIGVFFGASVQLFFIGIIGEYIGAIYTHVLKRPLVIERERIGFGAKETQRGIERDPPMLHN